MEDIKGITEETAMELMDAFDRCQELFADYHGVFNSFIDGVCVNVEIRGC